MGGLDKLEYYFKNKISDTISLSMPTNSISGLYTSFGIIQIIPPDGLSSCMHMPNLTITHIEVPLASHDVQVELEAAAPTWRLPPKESCAVAVALSDRCA